MGDSASALFELGQQKRMVSDLFYFGLTFETAPLVVREAIQPDAKQTKGLLRVLGDAARSRCVLTTCERLELYGHAPVCDVSCWIDLVSAWSAVPRATFARYAQFVHGSEVARHLLRVAAGLESRVLGEPHILGQVRDAYGMATTERSLDPILSGLCRAAIRTGKRVRHETQLNRTGRSIATLAVERVPRLLSARVGVVGSGKLARHVSDELSRRRAGKITIVARNELRAREIAAATGADVVPMSGLRDAMHHGDAVITCTSSDRFVVDEACFVDSPHAWRLLTLVDLSMPRNIDPALSRLAGVSLVDLDGLLACEQGHDADASAAVAIVEDELRRFESWRRERRAAPAIEAMCRRAQTNGTAQTRRQRRFLHERIMRVKQSVAS